MKYRKIPVEIEAFRFGIDEYPDWFQNAFENPNFSIGGSDENTLNCLIDTLEGTMKANYGDWIIKGVNGEIYPCKNDIFEKTYVKSEQ